MLIALHAAATLYMTGVIWFVQLVHYPLMARVGADGFAAYEALHRRYTGWVVSPAMLLEAATALALWWRQPSAAAWTGGLVLVAVIWLSTFLLQVPMHDRLSGGTDRAALGRLVKSNWIRTAAWTARAMLVVWWIATNYRN
jgi:uncharacterized membrane protein